ncbi:MAG: N,N-dimethylformamidase beta subunit family domain-containing protein [Gaiella sp.]
MRSRADRRRSATAPLGGRGAVALLGALALVAFALAVGAASGASRAAAAAADGTWRVVAPREPRAIEGYASQTSVAPGEALELHVATMPGERYRIEVHRIGWYGGSGGRRVLCAPVGCRQDLDGVPRVMPEPNRRTGETRVDWPVTDRVVVPSAWRSGYYLAKLILTTGTDTGRAAAVPFAVRPPAGARPALLVVLPVNTWQQYNAWGGLNTYTDKVAAVRVSFDRPYAHDLVKPLLDYPIVRFVDQFRYDAGYVTDVDVDRDPSLLLRTQLVVVPGHSEYWTKRMRDGLERARDAGVDLAFLSGNTGYWQTRYTDASRRALLQYRSAAVDPITDPSLETVRWRDQPVDRQECELIGVQWQGGHPLTDPGVHPYTVARGALTHPWFRGTGFRAGDRVRGAVGYEWDAIAPECAATNRRVRVLFHYEGKRTPQKTGVYTSTFHSTNADLVTYRARSGATVLAVGSIDFGWTLTGDARGGRVAPGLTRPETPPDPRMQRFMRNAFDELTRAG